MSLPPAVKAFLHFFRNRSGSGAGGTDPSAAAAVAAGTSLLAARMGDFADRWPPMVVRELRQGLRAKGFVIPFLLLHGLVLMAVAVEFSVSLSAGPVGSAAGILVREGPGLFWMAVYAIVAGVMPLRLMESLQAEKREGNAELLLLGGLTRWQVVRGKWLVQAVLTLLALFSLLPYMLARYFFGGVELVQNAFSFLSVLAAALGMAGAVTGASGYGSLGMRFFLIIGTGLLLGLACVFTESMIGMMAGAARRTDILLFGYIYSYLMLLHVLYAMMGLQLGRGHLRQSLQPWEMKPTKNMVTLMIITPFILVAGAFVTLGWGAIAVPALMIFSMIVADRPQQGMLGGVD